MDLLVAFDEPMPISLIERIRPDLYVKGGDYAVSDLPEREAVEAAGGSVHILPFVEDRSTSSIIDRIRQNPDGVRPASGVSLASR